MLHHDRPEPGRPDRSALMATERAVAINQVDTGAGQPVARLVLTCRTRVVAHVVNQRDVLQTPAVPDQTPHTQVGSRFGGSLGLGCATPGLSSIKLGDNSDDD